MVFLQMIEIESQITDEWRNPKEGFNEDFEENEDFELTRFGMNSVDRYPPKINNSESSPQSAKKLPSRKSAKLSKDS